MKPNINDLSTLPELKRVLEEKRVSGAAISTIEKALERGMVFRKPEDLALLNIPVIDLTVITDNVEFGTPDHIIENLKRLEYTFKPVEMENETYFHGYQFTVTYTNKGGFSIEQSFPIEDRKIVIVDLDLNDILDDSKVLLQVKTAQGIYTEIALSGGNNEPSLQPIEIGILALANETIDVKVKRPERSEVELIESSYQIKGKLISTQGENKLDGYQIVIFAATTSLADGTPDFVPVAYATTESNGYFITSLLVFNYPEDITRVQAAQATIARDDITRSQPIRLVQRLDDAGGDATPKSMLPDRLILVIEGNGDPEEECKDCGCNELNFLEKKVLEEYSYYTVVRTTEPSIIADVLEEEKEIDLEDVYGAEGRGIIVPISVFRKFHLIESKQIKPTNFPILTATVVPLSAATNAALPPGNGATAFRTSVLAPVRATEAATEASPLEIVKPAFNKDLLEKLLIEHKAQKVIRGNEKPVFRGRTYLNQLQQIDWDHEPTLYQAASIAHGHLLHFKQEWMPDGYSIGDLVYSLPLAPGQKKQIAVLDWERRESAARSESLDYEEVLNNSLVRDRDVNEVVSATLTENIKGNSKATTGGWGFGLGAAVMGVFSGGSYGGLLGISGGSSSSGANASQSAYRESTANSLQSISDRTMQAASVVRSQRSTVVQTVSQGERVQATAESVANYNHCHAITIQYFEVLRHFTIRNRLAGVQECLFVPLQMAPFDLDKCLRWRNTLERHLFRPELRPTFDAVTRIQNEKESPYENYYDSIGFPRTNYAEQDVTFYSGDLYIQFYFSNTKEQEITEDLLAFYNFFGISLDGLRDRKITDEELANHVGPRAIEYLLDAFTIKTDKGTDLKLDLTLLSTFRQNAILRVSVRKSASTPLTIPRNQINGINIKLDLAKISQQAAENPDGFQQFENKFMKIRVHSGRIHYRTPNFSGSLFDGRIDNDLFSGSDGVLLDTSFLTSEELRNPRGEDVEAANNLIHHLNENLEYYHKCIFFDMTPERRFMLLDGIIAPGKAGGRSVASVVENKVIGIAGNSLIMPVAPGNQLDPTIDEDFDMFAQYYNDEQEPMRISIPTRGIYAEAVMGQCNSCEEKDESRFWRWEESPIPDSPTTQILPLNTETRRADPGDLEPKDFPSPIVNIQNAPAVPDPTGLQSILQLIGKGDSFRDLTGLNQNQLNALATFQKTLDTAQAFGKEAAELAKAAAANKLIEDAQKSGAVSNEKAKELTEKNIKAAIPPSKEETMGLAQKQLDLINTLEQQGGLQAEAAQSARKNILDSLTQGLDSSGTNAGIIGAQDLLSNPSIAGKDIEFENDLFKLAATSPGAQTGTGGTGSSGSGGTGPGPSLAHMAFDHILLESLDPATSTIVPGVVRATPAVLTTPFYDASVIGVRPDPTLQSALTSLIDGTASYKNAGNNIAVAIVDLSGANKFSPKYAGFNDITNFYGASVNKITGLLGVYQLLAEANELLKANTSIGDETALETELKSIWTQVGIADQHHPLVTKILTVQPGSPATATLRPELITRLNAISSGNQNGSTPIVLLKFPYIGSTMLAHGLYSPVNNAGLWTWAAYGPINYLGQNLSLPNWPSSENPHPRTFVHNINAVSVAQFYTLAAQRRMIDEATSKAVLGHLVSGGCTSVTDVNKDLLENGAVSGQVATKCGVFGEWTHNTLHFKETATLREFVIVMLTKNYRHEIMKNLFKDLVALFP